MDKAELILYGVATYLAIKSLVSLMTDHRETYKNKLAADLKAAAAAAPPATGPTIAKSGASANPRTAAKANTAKPAVKNPASEVAKPEVAAKKAG